MFKYLLLIASFYFCNFIQSQEISDGIYELETVDSDPINKLPKFIKIQTQKPYYSIADESYRCGILQFNSLDEYISKKVVYGGHHKTRIITEDENKKPYIYYETIIGEGWGSKKFEARIEFDEKETIKVTIKPVLTKDPKLVGHYKVNASSLKNIQDSIQLDNFKTLSNQFYRYKILDYYLGVAEYRKFDFENAKKHLTAFVKSCQNEFARNYSEKNYVFDYEASYVEAVHTLNKTNYVIDRKKNSPNYILQKWEADDSIWPERLTGGIFFLCDSTVVDYLELIKIPNKNIIICNDKEYQGADDFAQFINDYSKFNTSCN